MYKDDDIRWIRKNYIPYDEDFGMRNLARKFNVDHATMSSIIHYKTYKEIY